jgi:L-rhamnonate dehydratase
VYAYHFMVTRPTAPFAEFLVMSADGASVVPMLQPLLTGEPVPERGRIRLGDAPGFGVELNRELPLERPSRRE